MTQARRYRASLQRAEVLAIAPTALAAGASVRVLLCVRMVIALWRRCRPNQVAGPATTNSSPTRVHAARTSTEPLAPSFVVGNGAEALSNAPGGMTSPSADQPFGSISGADVAPESGLPSSMIEAAAAVIAAGPKMLAAPLMKATIAATPRA